MMRKGQYYVVEQTILIGAGIVIALGFLAAFNTMRGNIQDQTLETQTQLVSRLFASTGVEIIENDVEGTYTISLPRTLSGEQYLVTLTGRGVETTSSGVKERSSLFGLEAQITTEGNVESDAGGAVIGFEDGTLRIRPQ